MNVSGFPLSAKAVTGFIPDRPYVYEKLTAFEFLDFVGGLHGLSWKEIATRGGELLETFALGRWADSLIESFSHGSSKSSAAAGDYDAYALERVVKINLSPTRVAGIARAD